MPLQAAGQAYAADSKGMEVGFVSPFQILIFVP